MLRKIVEIVDGIEQSDLVEALVDVLNEAERQNLDLSKIVDETYGRNLLHWVIYTGNEQLLKELLNTPLADVINAKDISGGTPLHSAMAPGLEAIVRLLLEAGAQPSITDNEKNTPLHLAAQVGNMEAVVLLLNAGVDVNAKDSNGNTPLHYAAMSGDIQLIEWLIDHKAKINAQNFQGETPAHFAAQAGKGEAIRCIASRGGNIDMPDHEGNTPLHTAAESGSLDAAEMLLDMGVDINAKNADQETPLHIAVRYGNEEVELLLRQRGTFINEEISAIPLSRTIKEEIKHRKRETKYQTPLAANYTRSRELDLPLTDTQAMLSLIEYQDPKHAKMFDEEIQEAMQNPILKELISFAALSRKNDVTPTGKRLQIKGAKTDDTSGIRIMDPPKSGGVYTQKNTVFFAAGDNVPVEKQWETILHEIEHYRMNVFFENGSNPFPVNGLEQERFSAITERVYNNLNVLEENNPVESEFREAFLIIRRVFDFYPRSDWESELIVRVPQIIAAFGEERGTQWLSRNVPELFDYYNQYIQPKAIVYNNERRQLLRGMEMEMMKQELEEMDVETSKENIINSSAKEYHTGKVGESVQERIKKAKEHSQKSFLEKTQSTTHTGKREM